MNNANFFWSGQNFRFLEYIVIKSHISVGHEVSIWLHGDRPNNEYWKMLEPNVTIKDADVIFNTSDFISKGGTLRTASDLWRFNYLYQNGGLYCDTDAFALKAFPDTEWIVCSAETIPGTLSIGVLKAPPNHPMFLDCISLIKNYWGNVLVFSQVYKQYFGNAKPTHKNELFYPYKWNEYKKLFKRTTIPLEAFSIHFYSNVLENQLRNPKTYYDKYFFIMHKLNSTNINIEWCEKHPATLLGKLWKSLSIESGVTNSVNNNLKTCNEYNICP